MPLEITWTAIAARLALAAAAGALIGVERGEQGRAAGLRTTLLVCLAAATAMVLANLLLIGATRFPDAIRTFDVLRLPLGILSGMGFIGAGAILHRKDVILGVTTAATLWFVTVAGLCFGSGHLVLGSVTAALGLAVLRGLNWAEDLLRRDRLALLEVQVAAGQPAEDDIRMRIRAAGFRLTPRMIRHEAATGMRIFTYELAWQSRRTETSTPPVVAELAALTGVASVEWKETAS